jgi:2-polyprenyl-3-methyl-5-hydroxy-6-metoxy-1,4-benzoquinol methylase
VRDTPELLPSVDYEPTGELSLFERWESGEETALQPPLAVRDRRYRELVVHMLEGYRADGRARLVSLGAGNGFIEAELQNAGWDVLATDATDSALAMCKKRGLQTKRFCLLKDEDLAMSFDLIYCDGVMGHLWQPKSNCQFVWTAIARLGRQGSMAVVSNDLADIDASPNFRVRGSPSAQFYRPTAGSLLLDARLTRLWEPHSTQIYEYFRRGSARRRELLATRLLVDKGVEAEDCPEFFARD